MVLNGIIGRSYRKLSQPNSNPSFHHLTHSIQSSLKRLLLHSPFLFIWIIIYLINKYLWFLSSLLLHSYNSIHIRKEDSSIVLFSLHRRHVIMISCLLNSQAISLLIWWFSLLFSRSFIVRVEVRIVWIQSNRTVIIIVNIKQSMSIRYACRCTQT